MAFARRSSVPAPRVVEPPNVSAASAAADRLELERLRVPVEASKMINSSIEPRVLFSTVVTLAKE